jgi:hypothetical protein
VGRATLEVSTHIPPEVRAIVLARDGYHCMAQVIDIAAGICRDAWGNPITGWWGRDPGPSLLQMSHTKDQGELAMSKKAVTDPAHLISLCPGHHTGTIAGSNWEAVNRNRIRAWLEALYG